MRHKTSPIWRHHNGSILKLKKHGKRQIYFLCDLKTKPHQLLNTMQWSLEAPSWSTSIYNNEDFIKQLFTLNLRTRHGEHPTTHAHTCAHTHAHAHTTTNTNAHTNAHTNTHTRPP